MNQSGCTGKTLKPWPVFVDHFSEAMAMTRALNKNRVQVCMEVYELPE
ncbi:hypothetical protein HL670_03389 [Serratia plymuthica]|nr:hypothetical protein HL670_03389 [Serratia plymuthica]